MTAAGMVCITGGSGFIGTNLCRRLADRQVEFRVLDCRQGPLFSEHRLDCDIRDIEALRRSLAGETIIHLAAVHRDDVRPPSRYHEVNVAGTDNIATVAREKGITRIVFASTVAVYGFAPPGTGERGRIQPFNEYGRTKFQAEEILRAWQAEAPRERSLTIVRPTVVFGPGNRGNMFNLLNFISSGKFVMIGKGQNYKSVAHVDNVAAFLHFAAGFGPGVHLYNYVDKPDLTMNELVAVVRRRLLGKQGVGLRLPFFAGLMAGHAADALARVSGISFPLSAIRVRKFCATTRFSSAAHEVDGFVAETPLLEGLETTLEREFIDFDPTAPVFFTE